MICRSIGSMVGLNGQISTSISRMVGLSNMSHISSFVGLNGVVCTLILCLVKVMCDIGRYIVWKIMRNRDIMALVWCRVGILLGDSGDIMSNVLLMEPLLLLLFFPLRLNREVSKLSNEVLIMMYFLGMLSWSWLDPYFLLLFFGQVCCMVATNVSRMIGTLVTSRISSNICLYRHICTHIMLTHREVGGMFNNNSSSLVMCNILGWVFMSQWCYIFCCISADILGFIYGHESLYRFFGLSKHLLNEFLNLLVIINLLLNVKGIRHHVFTKELIIIYFVFQV